MARQIDAAEEGTSITDILTTHSKCRGVWIGTTQSLDFYFPKAGWITFKGCTAGTVLPIQVLGARVTGGATPASGDVVFLY